jgi:hypothetical protein
MCEGVKSITNYLVILFSRGWSNLFQSVLRHFSKSAIYQKPNDGRPNAHESEYVALKPVPIY